MSSHSFTVDNKAAQKKKVNDDIEMALGIVTSLSENRPEISEISRITDKFKESSVWKEVESSLNYFKSITNPEDTNALSLVAFINEGKLRQFCYNIILLGSYIDDRQCFDVDKRIQNLQKYIKDAVLWIRDEKPVAKPCKLIQSNIYELENILSSWKDASIFLESEVIIQNTHKFMLMRQEPLLLLRTESETCRIQQSYSVCVTNLSQKLLSLSVKIGSLQPCSTINQLCNLFLDINSEITPLLEVVNGFYKWSLATNFVDYKYIAFATLIDWCSHVITLHQERSIFLNQTLSQLVFMLESMRDILPKECITVVNTFEHDKARILDGVVSVRSVLLHATNIKEFQNDFVPNCYQVYVQFLENCMKLRAPSQDSWLTTGTLNVDSNSIKVMKNLLFNLNWELRKDFLMAKKRFCSIYISDPSLSFDVVLLCRKSIENLQNVSSLPQININAWTQDTIAKANFLFNACSDLYDCLVLLTKGYASSIFSRDLSLFFESLYSKEQVNLLPIIQDLLKDVKHILEEEMVLQSQRQIQSRDHSNNMQSFDIDFFVLLNLEKFSSTDDIKVALHFIIIDDSAQGSQAEFITTERKHNCAVMTSKVTFDEKYLGRKLYYKYFIFSTGVNLEELLYIRQAVFSDCSKCCRARILPTRDELLENSYCIYDPIIYPQEVKGTLEKFVSVMFLFDTTAFKEPDRKREVELCFRLYLGDYVTQKHLPPDEIVTMYLKLSRVYKSLKYSIKVNTGDVRNQVMVLNPSGKTFEMVLIEEIKKVLNNRNSQCILQYIVLCHFLVCLINDSHLLSGDFIDSVLSSLQVAYESENNIRKCFQFEIIQEFQHLDLMKKLLKDIFLAVKNYFESSKPDILSSVYFIKALPLYHWFVDPHPTKPFTELDVKPDVIIDLIETSKCLCPQKIWRMQDVLRDLDLIHLKGDAKLQAILFVICPPSQYSVLLSYVSLPVIFVGVSLHIASTNQFDKKALEAFEKLLPNVKSKHSCPGDKEALSFMVSSLRGKIQKSSKNFIAVCIKTMFTLTASHKSLVVFIDVLQELVCAHMESLSFGGKSFDYQKEHEFWMNFIKCNENSNEWQKIVGELVYKRVKKISKLTSLIEAFKSLFKEDEANTVVKVIITAMEESIAASTFNQKDLGTLAHHTSKWSKSLFSRCFDEKYPNPDSCNSIETVLEFDMLPVIMKSYSSDSKGFSELSNCLVCKLFEIMQHSQDCITSGNIAVNLFNKVERKWHDHLYPILTSLKLDVCAFKKAMDSANNRIILFQFHQALLVNFISYLDKELNKELKVCKISPAIIDDMHINELCVEDGEKLWKYPFLEAADPVKPLLIPCAVMTSEKYKNDIFHQQCKDQVKCLNNTDTWPQIAVAVEAAFESCTLIVAKLRDQSITLHEIDTLFRSASSAGVVAHTLSQLESALLFSRDTVNFLKSALTFSNQKPPCSVSSIFITPETESLSPWINEVATNVYLWRGLSPLLIEAQDFADILNDLEVEPAEFIAFSNLSLHTTKLKSVASEKEILEFMRKTKELTGEIKDSIRMFAKSKKLREWILAKSEDLNAMETFIGVVLDTLAEEGDEIQDRLTNLSELCSKFSLLIYNFDESKSKIKCLIKLFEDTYKKLSDLSGAISLVEICNNDFEWYKRIGELQGSIEQGAVTQMREINQHGSYSIQSSGDSHKCRVSLSIVQDKKHIVSLDDLNELESKLVLITRKHSSWAEEKELFQEMLKRIILISESVQKLKDFGHLEYLDWEKKYHCPEYVWNLKSLDQEISTLENTLISWMYNVWNCRYEFPELNYYTTEQLIVFRKELTLIKNDPSKEVNPQVFYLLHSVVGEPVDSTMLLKKGLKYDEKFSIVHEDNEEDSSSIEVAQPVDFLLSVDDAVSLNASEVESISVLQEAMNSLNEKKREIYHELVNCGYQNYKSVEAATLHDDIYNAMDWCDELEDKDEETLRNKYFPAQTTATSTNSLSFSQDCSLTVSEQNPIKISVMPDFVHFDVTPIVSMFVSSDIHFTLNLLMDDKKMMMSLNDLGDFLKTITKLRGRKQIKRSFPEQFFEKGQPNLVVAPADEIFNCVIQIYAEDEDAPLPCYEEILLCSSNTTLEQVVVFWMRTLFDQYPGRIYCLVHAEKLGYLVSDKAIDLLLYLSQGITDYRLVIVCSNESEGKSHVITRLNSYHRNWKKNDDLNILKKYLKKHFIPKTNDKNINASIIDDEESLVRIIYSKQAAAGKSLHIRKMKDRLNAVLKEKDLLISKKKPKVMLSIPLHGPDVTPDEVLKMLLAEKNVVKSCIIHIDVPQQVLHSIDDILFSIIILQGLSDSRGQIWRCRSTHFYAIEMTIPSETSYIRKFTEARRALSLLYLVPNKECYQPLKMMRKIGKGDLTDLRTPMYQRVYKYLKLFDSKKYQELEKFQYIGTLEDTNEQCLETIIKHCGTTNPTWKEIRHFVWFLNHQLSACEQSNVIKTVKGLKTFTVKFMIDMSRDFATSSMPNEEGSEDIINQHNPRQNWEHSLHPYLFFNKNRKSVTHVGLALNGLEVVEDKSQFHQHKFTMQISPEVERFLSLKVNVPKISQQKIGNVLQRSSNEGYMLLKRLVNFMNIPIEDGIEIISPDENYVLTQDNLTKIMGIQTRFRCQIPVVLMGETGCGKTHLIRFMCKVAAYDKNIKNMFIIKIHGGTTEDDVIKCLEEAEFEALKKNRKEKVDTVVFFDEANTSDVISLIKEIMCDGKCRGKPVPPFLKFVAACNPYRRHSEAMIKQLKGAGLGWRDKEPSRATEKLGEIPLRDLVYRVLKIPDSLKALVYDFGKLDSNTERDYIYQIVHSRLKEEIYEKEVLHAIAHVLAECQKYLKNNQDECSFVSLRDVERAMIFFRFFYNKFIVSFPTQRITSKTTDSLLLALTVSYFARLDSQDVDDAARTKFEDCIFKTICNSKELKCLSVHHAHTCNFRPILSGYQNKLLDCMSIEENIARNAALRENLFMMFVCIQLRIPLFLVGKPGSSKSLAKTIIQNSMRGQNSKNKTLKQFNHVHIHSYQCSELSTAGSIREVFYSAVKYQEKRRKNDSSFVSVVVLDEVGLAEASPYLPLKSLHPLLEDGTEGTGSTDTRVKREDRVAFVGISNWALDPAKMNRGILVRRSEPSINDLIDSAKGICSDKDAQTRLAHYFDNLARAYHEIFKNQPTEFFGLRDYYSLIKMLHWMTKSTGTILTVPQLRHAIKRNFSGFTATKDFDPYKCFLNKLPELENVQGASNLMKRLHNKAVVLLKGEKSKLFLATACNTTLEFTEERNVQSHFVIYCESQSGKKKLFTFQSLYFPDYFIAEYRGKLTLKKGRCYFSVKEVKSHGIQLISMTSSKPAEIEDEANFFPIHPENSPANPDCSPRGLIRESLINRDTSKHGESRYLLFLTDNYSSLQILKHYIMSSYSKSSASQYEPFVLFGSSFPKDRDFAQVCRNISEIRLCMETGRMIILLNLENLYESLYDLLNQYYIKSGRHRYVDLGLRTHRMKCSVHEDFKLILIAEKKKVYDDFPTPLVNRLEKHFINNETVLEDWQKTVVDDIEKWLKSFMTDNDGFKIKDAFVGYNSDTKAAVVLQATTQFQMSKNILEKEKMVLQLSKKLLLQMATPDAVVRALKKDTEEGRMFLKQVYFNEQEHSSLVGLLQRISWHDENTFLLQVTSHSLPMYQKEIHSLKESLRIDDTQLERAHLEAFETEYEFLASVDGAIDKGKMKPFYQIYECEFGQDNGNLISCCRYRLVDKIKELTKGKSVTLFVLIVHLPRKCDNTDFVSFQEYPWVCYHVDELIPSKESKALLRQIVCQSNHLSHLFLAEGTNSTADKLFNTVNDPNQYLQLFPLDEAEPVNFCSRVHTYITDAVSQLDQSEKIQSSQKIKKLESLISKNAQRSQIFYSVTIALMKRVLEGMDDSQWWVFEEAISIQHLQEGGSFSNVLIRRFDKTLKPLFIQIIRFIDRHSNLQLLMPDCLDENDKPLSKLWLNIYSSWELCQSTLFKVVASQKYEKIDQKVFQCSFPFSWIIYEYINKKIDDDNEDILQDFELQECFKSLPPALFKEFAAFYSHDFVFLLRSSDATHCELLSKALLTMSYATINDESNFIEILSEIHFTYSNFEEYFECFLDLAVEMPSIVRAITDKNETISDISSLIVVALQEVLNNIHLDEKVPLKGTAALRGWMQKMYQLQAIIDNIFNNLHLDNCHELKKQWQRLCVMKLFMEHVVVDHENELLKFATRLDRYSDKIEDYRGPQVLKSVSTLLIAVEDVVMKEIDKTDQISIKESCWNFFVDVLLNFCDSDNKEVLEILVDSVFSNASEIPKLHTYIQRHPEKLPFLHSFTIKLILSEDLFMATDHLLKIKDCIAASVSGQTKISMNSFFALVIAYLKMKTHKEGSLEMSEIVYCTDTLLGSSCEILLSASSNGEMTSPECLLAIAQLMYSCQLLAKTVADEDYRSLNSTADVDYFYNKADPVFQKPELNDDADKSGPLFFLIRFVVRRYGISVLTKLMELQYQQFSWVLSSNMDIDDSLKERQFVNYGAIYQPQYQKFYEAISEATTVTGDFKALEKISNSATSVSNLVPLIMALQYRMQLSYVSSTPSNRLSPDKIKALHNFIKQCKHFNSYREISKCIEEIVIKNCGIIPAIKVLKEDSFRTIIFRTLLIHSVLTVQANRQSPLISVLHSLLTSPDTLQGCMLPGMPSSTNTGTVSIEVPLFPECTKGHKFPSTMVDISCPECGNIIQSPQPAYPQFIPSATGYVPVAVGCETPPFGYLNGISYSIIRCIIHCILLWATHDGKNVGQILNGKIDDPESYFWIQIEIDINDLSKAFSCSVEEASFVIHFVLKKINEKCLQVGILPNVVRSITQLRSIADREQWEELFHQFFITPVLENFEVHLLESISKMHSDTDYSALFDSAYMAHRNADPFLWQVYPEPTLEYLRHGLITFQRKDTNPVLFTLITESSCINATVCISDIIALQRKLSQNKVDEEKTFEDFVQLLDDIEKENYEALVKSLTMAWSSCRHCLMNNYDRLNTTEALKVEEIAADTPMKYLIPTTSGPGVLSTALVDHLVIVHNSFIKLCRDFVENNLNKRWMWEAHKVSLREMDSSLHAVNCNTEKLRELVTTHSVFIANPSGTIGIQYMLDNLEKDIVQQYVLGKPFIIDTLNIPTVENVVKLRQVIVLITKNIEQSPLPLKVKSDFRSDLKTVQVIVGTCEVLEVAMKFLSKQTAPKTMKLSEYIEVDLLMKERIRSKKIMEYCNLEHVVGLWRFLQVECARVKNRHKINPFEHVRKQFRNTLKPDARAALEKAAHKVSDLDYLLEMLFEFIHTYVQYCDVNDSQKPLHQIFEDFLKQTRSKIISDLNKIFPHKVLLSQVTDCWKFLADFEDSIKKLKSY